MGKTFDTGYLRNIIAYDASGNVGIGGAVDASYKLKITGAFSGTSANFSGTVTGNILSFTNGTYTGNIKFGGLDASAYAFDLVYQTNTALRFGVSGGDGPQFQGWGGTAPAFAGQMYFDFGSYTRNITGRALYFRSMTTGTVQTVLTIASTGDATFSSSVTARLGMTIYGAAGAYTTGDNPFIGLGTGSADTFGAINAPFGDKMKLNAYHGFEFKTSNGGASGTPVSKLILSTLGYLGINTSSPRGILNTKNGTGELIFSQTNGRDIEAYANGSRGNMDLICLQLYISNLGTGTVYSNGGVLTNTNPSDKNLKENITDLSFGLNEILQLRPVSYDWKNNPTNQSTQYGFIAQEVQEILPQLVTEFDSFEDDERQIATKRLGLDKDAIFVSLVKAIQELKAEIDILKAK